MATITMEISDDLLANLSSEGHDADRTLRLAAAFFLCRQGKLSTSQAARLAGLPYAGFLESAARAKAELFPINFEELKEEISGGFTLGR
jgi:predicted HTH domain antitoxin